MFGELREVCDALETVNPNPIDDQNPRVITVIRTRWVAAMEDPPYNAVVVDITRPEAAVLMESGQDVGDGMFFYIEIAVDPEYITDPLEAVDRLGVLVDACETALKAAFPYKSVTFLTPEIIQMPWGKTQSLSFIADLYIG